jgi:hypothetical protein
MNRSKVGDMGAEIAHVKQTADTPVKKQGSAIEQLPL